MNNDVTESCITYTIYSLINLDNGKRYIGRTQNLEKRLKAHFSRLKGKKHENPLLNEDAGCRFEYEVLEENVSLEDRTEKERGYILLYHTDDPEYGYNANDPCLSQGRPKKHKSKDKGPVGLRINHYLNSRGIRKVFLSKKTGISQERISNMLAGKAVIYIEEYCAICRALNVPFETFVQ